MGRGKVNGGSDVSQLGNAPLRARGNNSVESASILYGQQPRTTYSDEISIDEQFNSIGAITIGSYHPERERFLYPWVDTRIVSPALIELYAPKTANQVLKEHLTPFRKEHSKTLQELYSQDNWAHCENDHLTSHAEAALVLERLVNAPEQLESIWSQLLRPKPSFNELHRMWTQAENRVAYEEASN